MRSNAMKRLLKIRAKNIFWIYKQVTAMSKFSHILNRWIEVFRGNVS